jgi:uncharacterized alkaline shock family protein YloU
MARMIEKRQPCEAQHLDPLEFDLPDTTFSRDIENRVFQGIVLKTLSRISGIGLLEGTFLENLIGRVDKVKGISTEQDPKTQSVKIKIEVSVQYGVSIPKKAEEIQSAVVEEITKMTGLRVSEIHVIFKELMRESPLSEEQTPPKVPVDVANAFGDELQSEF